MPYGELDHLDKEDQRFYRSIDIVRYKFDNNKKMTLNEACFVLWAEYYVGSSVYLRFQKYINKHFKDIVDKKYLFSIWHGLFKAFEETPNEKNYVDSLTKEV